MDRRRREMRRMAMGDSKVAFEVRYGQKAVQFLTVHLAKACRSVTSFSCWVLELMHGKHVSMRERTRGS